ncbi:ParM/StbA family protein [Coleofasciculus sp.]|uniref:ParM/StbA family protein n=1 Tax=Coleofasciculus sp. TaxID=3100458 RepID=UPI004063DD36
MEPEVISLPTQAIKDYEAQKIGSPVPLDSAWVSVDSDSYAVGYLARSRFNANAGLSSLKYERAFPKTLAAVWVAAQNLKLKNKFSAAIAILLPVSEYKSSDWLHELLVESLKKFNTPTGQMSVNLMAFDCKPEGCGIYMMRQLGDDAFAVNRKTIAVVMVGYRNASVLVSERGQITIKRTSDLGFVRLVELVEGRVALPPSTARLTTAIAKAGEKFNRYSFLPLASSTGEEARDMEVDRLIEAAKSSRSEYSLALSSWLREVIPRSVELDEVLLCGGTEYGFCLRRTS